MFKRVTEIKTQPVLILAASKFMYPDGLAEIEKAINAKLKDTAEPQAIVLPGIVTLDSWQYGRVETITETTDQEPGDAQYLERSMHYAQAEDASGTAGDI